VDRLTGKRAVSALVIVPALLLLLAATRPWLTGRSADPLLGGGAVSATGSQLAPGVVALAAVALVALLATLTSGPWLRRACAVLLLVAALGAVALTVRPLLDPEGTLGRVAASGLGRTGEVRTTAAVAAWAWLALVAAVLLTLAALLALVAAGRWSGLSSRFEPPAPRRPVARTQEERRRSAWDAVSEGRDPDLDSSDTRDSGD
jgi:uncharacterized membrane protein (TIGR02234 family)